MRIRVTLTAVALALGIVALGNAQVYKPGGGGGGGAGGTVTAGTTATSGCGAAGVLFSASSLVQCDTGFTYAGTGGAVALTGILQLPDTTGATVGVVQYGGARFLHDMGSTGNVFLGHNSGNFTLTNTTTTCVGESCMLGAVAGANNTCVGRFCMGGALNGAGNTALGNAALSANTNGGSNVGVGNAANAVTTASNTTCVGAGSCAAATGASTTTLGSTAGSAVTGANNTFIGAASGTSITSTAGNTIVGQGCTGTVGDAATVQIGNAGCAAFMDFGKTTAATWSFGGALAATLAAASGTSSVCNTAGTKTALTLVASGTACGSSAIFYKNLFPAQELNLTGFDDLRADTPWSYKPDSGLYQDGKVHVGLFADDVEKLDSRCVVYGKHGVENYEDRCILAYLVKIVQLQKSEIEDLKRRVR